MPYGPAARRWVPTCRYDLCVKNLGEAKKELRSMLNINVYKKSLLDSNTETNKLELAQDGFSLNRYLERAHGYVLPIFISAHD